MANRNPLILISGLLKELTSADTLIGNLLATTFSLRNVAGTFTNLLTNTTTADRTWTLQDKSYTLAGLDDLSTLTPLSEVPSGAVNGSNTAFTLSQVPANSEVVVTLNGLRQKKTTDYSISGTTLTFVVAPATGMNIEVFYVYSSTSTFVSNVFSFISVNESNVGTTPLLVARLTLPAGTYTSFSALLGADTSTGIATLEIKKSDGTSIKTLTRTGTPLQVSTTGFTLASDTVVSFYLYGDLSTTVSYVFSLGVV